MSDPSAYDGGELSIEIGSVAIPFKGAAGAAIVYPSTMLHEVVPVRSGQRLVSITFIESHIADEHQRTQVYELNEIAALEGLSMKWESRLSPRRIPRARPSSLGVGHDLREHLVRLHPAPAGQAFPDFLAVGGADSGQIPREFRCRRIPSPE